MPHRPRPQTALLIGPCRPASFQVGTSGSHLEPAPPGSDPDPTFFSRLRDGHADCFHSHPMTTPASPDRPRPDGDARLIAGLRRGDPEAIDALVDAYGSHICRRIERILGNRADAEEVAQDVLLLLVRKIHLFEGRAAFETWVHRVATNAALARLRRRRRDEEHSAAGPAGWAALAGHPASAEEELVQLELRGLLARAIETLPEPYRLPLVLHHLEGLSNEAIGARLGLGLAAVKSRVYRSRILVRQCLATYVAA